jgi:hypothetical protein
MYPFGGEIVQERIQGFVFKGSYSVKLRYLERTPQKISRGADIGCRQDDGASLPALRIALLDDVKGSIGRGGKEEVKKGPLLVARIQDIGSNLEYFLLSMGSIE